MLRSYKVLPKKTIADESLFYGHTNGFAVIIIAAIVITLFDFCGKLRLRHWVLFGISAVLLVFANSRSAILAVLFLLVILAMLVFFDKHNKNATVVAGAIMGVIIIGVLAFSLICPMLHGTDLGTKLEFLSREYLNKNFFSGRQVVWDIVLAGITGNELVGLGLNTFAYADLAPVGKGRVC